MLSRPEGVKSGRWPQPNKSCEWGKRSGLGIRANRTEPRRVPIGLAAPLSSGFCSNVTWVPQALLFTFPVGGFLLILSSGLSILSYSFPSSLQGFRKWSLAFLRRCSASRTVNASDISKLYPLIWAYIYLIELLWKMVKTRKMCRWNRGKFIGSQEKALF